MESVLNAPKRYEGYESGFVRIVHSEWKPEALDEENIADRDMSDLEEPFEARTEHDVKHSPYQTTPNPQTRKKLTRK